MARRIVTMQATASVHDATLTGEDVGHHARGRNCHRQFQTRRYLARPDYARKPIPGFTRWSQHLIL
jgi:hypothetical protein